MQAYAVRAYNELADYLEDELGVPPSPQSVQMMRQVVDMDGLGCAMIQRSPRRRGAIKRAQEEKPQNKASFAFGDALPVQRERFREGQ